MHNLKKIHNEDYNINTRDKKDREDFEMINQEEYLQKYFEETGRIDKGICLGLSTVHIIEQLQSENGKIVSPFDSENLLLKSHHVQIVTRICQSEGYQDQMTCASKLFNTKCGPSLRYKYRDGVRTTDINSMEQKLKRKIDKTSEDKQSRGALISGEISRNPLTEQDVVNISHAWSMTIQYDKNQKDLYCTSMDSNFFFAVGKGRDRCTKLAEGMTSIMKKKYGVNNIQYYSPTKNKSSL